MHPARAGEDPVAAIRVLEAPRGRKDLGHPRDPARSAATDPAERPEGEVGEDEVVDDLLGPASGSGGVVGASVPLRQGPPRVGNPVELDVVGAGHEPVEVIEDLVDPHRLLDGVQPEGPHGLDRHRGDDAERTDSHPSGLEDVWVLVGGGHHDRPVAGDQAQPHDPARDVPEVPPRAVGGRGGGSGDRLVGDVAHVLEGEAPQIELLAQPAEGDAGLDRDRAILRAMSDHPVIARQIERARRRCTRWA